MVYILEYPSRFSCMNQPNHPWEERFSQVLAERAKATKSRKGRFFVVRIGVFEWIEHVYICLFRKSQEEV